MYRTKKRNGRPLFIGRRQKVSLFLLSNKRQDNQVPSFLLYTIERKTKVSLSILSNIRDRNEKEYVSYIL